MAVMYFQNFHFYQKQKYSSLNIQYRCKPEWFVDIGNSEEHLLF